MTDNQVTVLLVDDDDIDVVVVRRAFARLRIENPIVVAGNGAQALAHLRGSGDRAKIKGPAIVLLDLIMPMMGGIEFLDELRGDPRLRHTVVFVLTASDAQKDRHACYERRVSGYLLKQSPGARLLESFSMLQRFWLTNAFVA